MCEGKSEKYGTVEKAFDEATKRTEIISAIATLYVTIVYANIKERTYELLEGYDFVRKILGQREKLMMLWNSFQRHLLVLKREKGTESFLNLIH